MLHAHILENNSAGAEELALDGTVMITGPISSNDTLRYLINFYVLFAFYVLSLLCWQYLFLCFCYICDFFFEKAVCYLNSYGKDFKGGLFHFQDGEPATLVPMAGVRATVVMMINCFVACRFCFTHFCVYIRMLPYIQLTVAIFMLSMR